jgi:hypothetical protein
MGHALMENRNGLILDAVLTPADGHAERVAALAMVEPFADRPTRVTLGADKGYDASDFINELRSMNVTPHVAAKAQRSALDRRTTRHAGYGKSEVQEADRGGVRLDQDRRRPAQDEVPRRGSRWLGLHLGRRRLQHHPHPETDSRKMIKASSTLRRGDPDRPMGGRRTELQHEILDHCPERAAYASSSAAC